MPFCGETSPHYKKKKMARIAKKANIVPIFSSAQTRMEWGFCFGEKSEVSINREVLSKIYEN